MLLLLLLTAGVSFGSLPAPANDKNGPYERQPAK